jgi:hypothetical protein
MLFSQRYLRALEQGTLSAEVPESARRKLWSQLKANDKSFKIRPDPDDDWISNTSVLEETESELMTEHGWDVMPGTETTQNDSSDSALRRLVLAGDAAVVFDILELASRWMDGEERERFRRKVNQILELHECPWRLSDGEFFKLDGDFVGMRLASTAHDALAANRFVGAADEYAKARQYLSSGDTRQAINFAGHSFESTMKVLSGLEHANADRLLKELLARGYFNDLPESVRAGFTDQVLKALPFLRNKLGGHGQGASVVSIPQAYGDLTVQLAAAFHNFLIHKHLERAPIAPEPQATIPSDDEPPF